ncbi:hypothetical protein PMAYCL1PPCAC_29585, partial [Pristionchus mayeri]
VQSNKSNKSSSNQTTKTPTKLLISGKEAAVPASAWPVRPCWSEIVPESQLPDDLSDFPLTKKTEGNEKTNKKKVGGTQKSKKEEKKDEKKDEKKEEKKDERLRKRKKKRLRKRKKKRKKRMRKRRRKERRKE